MKNELTITEKTALAILEDSDKGNLIKPLEREIHLFDTFIGGLFSITEKDEIKELKEGDELILVRKESKFDENTILVLNNKKIELGYIPEKDSIIFARLLDAGKCLKARVKKKDVHPSFVTVSIGIYLLDY